MGLTLLAYRHVLTFPFVYDDAGWLPSAQAWHWRQIAVAPYAAVRQIALMPYAAAGWMGGGLPGAFHGLVLGLHLLNGVLLWRVARRWLSPNATAVAVALFWLHPVQTEAVAYVSGGVEVLLATYVLVAWLGLRSASPVAAAGGVVVLLLAATVKWSAMPALVLVPLLLAPAWSPRRRVVLGSAAALALGALLVAVWAPVAGWLSRASAADATYASQVFVALWRYLAFVVWPVGFSIEHDWTGVTVAMGGLALSALFVMGAVAWRYRVLAAWAWVLGLIVPRALLPNAPPLTEHHTYLPFLAVWLVAGAATERIAWPTNRSIT